MHILDATGDRTVTWDTEVKDSTVVAESTFKEMLDKGYMGWKVIGEGKSGTQIRKFDQTAEKIILSTPFVGG
jgi:hypothetical protein